MSTRSRSPVEGAPLVAEFCLAELGTVLGISTTAAKKLVGHALELRHRLPRLWAQVHTGRVPAWRARSVAEVTIHSTPALTREAAAFVDAQVAAVAGRVGAGAAGPARRRDDQALRPRRRRPGRGSGGRLPPRRPAPRDDPRRRRPLRRHDAARGRARHRRRPRPRPGPRPRRRDAEGPRVRGVARRPPVRRPRRPRPDPDRARPPRPGRRRRRRQTTCPPPARSSSTPTSTRPSTDWPRCSDRPAGMEEGQRLVLLDQVKDWCADSRTKVTVKPVIDLNAELSTPALRGPRPDPRAGHPPRPRHACSRGAPDRPAAATSTTSSRTTPTPTRRADHNPVRRRPTTSPPCAGSTTASRPTPPGATG